MEIKVEPLSYVEQMKLAADIIAGGQKMSQSWWNMAKVAASIKEIDGRKILKPKHPRHVLKIIETVGDAGWVDATRQFNTFAVERDDAMELTVAPVTTKELWLISEYAGDLFDLPPWRGLALVALSVRSFNGADLECPSGVKELYERVELLGFQGMDLAVEKAMEDRLERDEIAAAAAKTTTAGN